MINAMSVDVEDYLHVSAFSQVIKRDKWDNYESRVSHNTHKLLDIFENKGIKSTFFVLGWVAERNPGLVREIAQRGHEVASHGFSHKLIYQQTAEEFREETVRSKQILEDQIQTTVLGYRAASYSITRQSLWALDILAEAGFEYDSSIFPTRHDRYGIPDAETSPHTLTTPNGNRLVEFPITTKKIANYNLPASGGGYFRLYPYFLTRNILKSITSKEKRPFIFYLHPWEVDPDQPRIEASRLSRFRHYNNLKKCESRLQRLIEDFQFSTVANVLQYSGFLNKF